MSKSRLVSQPITVIERRERVDEDGKLCGEAALGEMEWLLTQTCRNMPRLQIFPLSQPEHEVPNK